MSRMEFEGSMNWSRSREVSRSPNLSLADQGRTALKIQSAMAESQKTRNNRLQRIKELGIAPGKKFLWCGKKVTVLAIDDLGNVRISRKGKQKKWVTSLTLDPLPSS